MMLEHGHLDYVTLCVDLLVGWLTLFTNGCVFLLEAFMFQIKLTVSHLQIFYSAYLCNQTFLE